MYAQIATAMSPQPMLAMWMPEPVTTCVLTDSAKAEVLELLAAQPLDNVMLIGFILDNGLSDSINNRGTFYGCRNRAGELEGVALIGHVTLIEARTDRALIRFAELASECTTTHLIMGEDHRVCEFWEHYTDGRQAIRRACREQFLEFRSPCAAVPLVSGLRLATPDDLDLTMPVHAQMAFDESGVNPMETDPEGFRARCLRRMEKSRTWVWIESGELIFKADIVSDTPDVVYLEGVWTNPKYRSRGHGLRCISQLISQLRSGNQRRSVCVFVNEENPGALRFYERAGFERQGVFDTAFL